MIATSGPPGASFKPTSEEVLYYEVTVNGESFGRLSRADMVYLELPGGGAVFSVGSITFCGSLWRNGFEGPVSDVLENVVRKFAGLNRARGA